ncbi:hypothetical protein [Azorhizobium sp. AG788]|uniref:hypothetical protein n=1 Tax=Azorhizobium sp. AG788 TaxID=2183897 RepID=UPI003139156F
MIRAAALPLALPLAVALLLSPEMSNLAHAAEEVVNDTSLVLACKQKALVMLKTTSPSIEDIFIDMDGLTIAEANTTVGDTKIIGVMMGEAYIQRDKTDKVHRFLCLTGEGGKVLMTFFTER